MFADSIDDSDYYNDLYTQIINNTAIFCHELNVHDQISVFVVFCYLLWNGFFSEGKDYYFAPQKTIYYMDNLSFSVMTNYRVCLNNDFILYDILVKLQHKVAFIEGYLGPKIKLDYQTYIESKVLNQEKIKLKDQINDFFIKRSNHICILNINEPYLLDPTNNCLFYILNNTAYVLSGTGFFKPNIDNKTPMYIKKVLAENSKYIRNINIGEYFQKNVELCKTNKNLLDAFYDENYGNIKKISEFVKTFRK